MVIIHVVDEQRKQEKKFQCEQRVLVKQMQYFRAHLVTSISGKQNRSTAPEASKSANRSLQRTRSKSSSVSLLPELSITVHCDIIIFEWLMKYVEHIEDGKTHPMLTVKNVASILISAEFLVMDTLFDEAIVFMSMHLRDIGKLKMDLSMLSDNVIDRITKQLIHDDEFDHEINSLMDGQIKLFNRFYKSRCATLNAKFGSLAQCKHCGHIYASNKVKTLSCYANSTRIELGKYGDIIRLHEEERAWSCDDWIMDITDNVSWDAVYWFLRAAYTHDTCQVCNAVYNLVHVYHCRFHPFEPSFQTEVGYRYPCCEARAFSFLEENNGCKLQQHKGLEYFSFIEKFREKIDQLAQKLEIQEQSTKIVDARSMFFPVLEKSVFDTVVQTDAPQMECTEDAANNLLPKVECIQEQDRAQMQMYSRMNQKCRIRL